jgi:hypothetical protein
MSGLEKDTGKYAQGVNQPSQAPKIFRHSPQRKTLAAAKYAVIYGFFIVGTPIALPLVTKFAATRQMLADQRGAI